MFETYYPESAGQDEAAERYRDVPLGVEAAWPPPDEAGAPRQPAVFQMKSSFIASLLAVMLLAAAAANAYGPRDINEGAALPGTSYGTVETCTGIELS